MSGPFDDLTETQRQQIRNAHAEAKLRQPEPVQTAAFTELQEGVRYVPATEATAKLLVEHLIAAGYSDGDADGRYVEIYLDAAEDAIRTALGIEAKQR